MAPPCIALAAAVSAGTASIHPTLDHRFDAGGLPVSYWATRGYIDAAAATLAQAAPGMHETAALLHSPEIARVVTEALGVALGLLTQHEFACHAPNDDWITGIRHLDHLARAAASAGYAALFAMPSRVVRGLQTQALEALVLQPFVAQWESMPRVLYDVEAEQADGYRAEESDVEPAGYMVA